jgi:predicted Zn-dependent peptidase
VSARSFRARSIGARSPRGAAPALRAKLPPAAPAFASILALALVGAAAFTGAPAAASAATPADAPADASGPPARPVSTFTLPNGLTVVLAEDHSLPKVVIATRFAVGSKNEAPGRTGFAHLFEHLMFMGTHRVPGNQFDMLMETAGGENNAFTSEDNTTYYSLGPAEILPALLWLDADRLQQLDDAMTQEKLDLQRSVVRNERRQSYENAPYGQAALVLPEMLWPEGHSYRHPVIGSHEDLQAATLEDVKGFFRSWYVPGNAVLVVAGDFDPAQAREAVERTFGAVPARPVAALPPAPPAGLAGEARRVLVDQVEFPQLVLVWHSPARYAEGDAAMTLAASLLAGSASSRLDRRLKIERQLAQDIAVFQDSREWGGLFQIQITAAPGADLEEIKRQTLGVLADLSADGPAPEELARQLAVFEADFRRQQESFIGRAVAMTEYHHFLGRADGFAHDLARFTSLTPEAVRDAARAVFGPGRADLRILPASAVVAGADLDRRPEPFAPRPFAAPRVETFQLANGIRVDFAPRPGTGLFAGGLLVDGGERLLPANQAGLGTLTASLLTAGAGGRDATAFAAAVEALGGNIQAELGREALAVHVSGLSARLEPTLDLLADACLRPNLAAADFDRERQLQLAGIAARADNPNAVARTAGAALLYGPEDWRGRPLEGSLATVGALALADVEAAAARLLEPSRARFVFAGDCTRAQLESALAKRFGKWRGEKGAGGAPAPADAAPGAGAAAPGAIVLVDRPGAAQTVINIARAVAPAGGAELAVRTCINTFFGDSFTSRLNQNLREKHGFTYGARSAFAQDGGVVTLTARSSVQTAVTGAALTEFKREFDGLAGGDVGEEELGKAARTSRRVLIENAESTRSLAEAMLDNARRGRAIDTLPADIAAVDAVTLERTRALAQSGLYDWRGLLVVLVGDRAQVAPQLKEAGFPEPLLADEEGRLLPR